MSEWKKGALGDFITLRRGHDLPEQKRTAGEFPVFSSSGITGYHNECKISDSSVITGRYGTIGKVFFAESAHWPLNTTLYVEDFKGNDKKFIYYFLQTLDWDSFADIASAVPGINRNHVHLAQVVIPVCILEQRGIAEIIASLDDKIDLLTRQNATFEALAQTHFQQWFIENTNDDFKTMTISDVAFVGTGKGLKREDFKEHGQFPILGANGEIGKTNKYLFTKDDGVIITGRVGTHGKVFLINKNVWVSDNALTITPKEPRYRYVLYFVLKGLDYDALNVGSTQPLITQTDIKNQEFLGSSKLIESFNAMVVLLFEKIESNNEQVQTLQKLRDTLLPKLISGEVRVKI